MCLTRHGHGLGLSVGWVGSGRIFGQLSWAGLIVTPVLQSSSIPVLSSIVYKQIDFSRAVIADIIQYSQQCLFRWICVQSGQMTTHSNTCL